MFGCPFTKCLSGVSAGLLSGMWITSWHFLLRHTGGCGWRHTLTVDCILARAHTHLRQDVQLLIARAHTDAIHTVITCLAGHCWQRSSASFPLNFETPYTLLASYFAHLKYVTNSKLCAAQFTHHSVNTVPIAVRSLAQTGHLLHAPHALLRLAPTMIIICLVYIVR